MFAACCLRDCDGSLRTILLKQTLATWVMEKYCGTCRHIGECWANQGMWRHIAGHWGISSTPSVTIIMQFNCIMCYAFNCIMQLQLNCIMRLNWIVIILTRWMTDPLTKTGLRNRFSTGNAQRYTNVAFTSASPHWVTGKPAGEAHGWMIFFEMDKA